jgi:hypothetical protein
MQCQLCRREMASADPIYRVSVAYSMNMRDISHGGVFEVCAECCATKPIISVAEMPGVDFSWLATRQWRPPKPCEKCGRPVIWDMRRKLPKYVVCSDGCRRAVYGAVARAKLRALVQPRSCALCGAGLQAKRSLARYCSAACKQKAFRRRTTA